MKEEIIKILKDALPLVDFTPSEHMVDDGILDSISIMNIVSELSLEYDVEFTANDICPENFNSIDAIVTTVKSLLKG